LLLRSAGDERDAGAAVRRRRMPGVKVTVDVTAIGVRAPIDGRAAEVLTPEALGFVAALQREFGPTREALLRRRAERQRELESQPSLTPFDFLSATRSIREADWRVAPAPRDLQKRWVELTGPAERKMMINALNSGADVFMADFEDANSPTWSNMVQGQVNLIDAVERTIDFTSPEGKTYRLNEQTATLMVRPRGWHLPERHVLVDGQAVSGSLFDFGLFFFHNARRLLQRGTAPYFYLPKLESHVEARLWNDVFLYAQDALDIPRGTIRATVLIETIPAAFEMDEILYELRDHSGGLNAGRWDYMFSIIKKLGARPGFLLPDRGQVTMTVPFMRAYTELLVKTCHRRGAHALGGMAAFIPSRKDPKVNEVALAKVREDKIREAGDGFDGTWIAHPDLAAVAREPFARFLGERPHQLDKMRDDVRVTAEDLVDVRVPGGDITEAGLRQNVSVGIQYLASWLRGVAAVALYNLMEDAATAEISRSQVWQWVHHGSRLKDGAVVTSELVSRLQGEELAKIRSAVGEDAYVSGRYAEAAELFREVALSRDFVEFLTLPAYEYLDL
jgi:malate synthase